MKIKSWLKNKYYYGSSLITKKNDHPIVILGLQKSGTSAIANLLALGTGLSITSDITRAIKDPGLSYRLSSGIEPFDQFINKYAHEFSKDIIKEPFLSYHFYDLKKTIPNAKFVFIKRNPFDNIRSILNRLAIPGDLERLNVNAYLSLQKTPVWRSVFKYNVYDHEHYIEAMAKRWCLLNETYLQNQKDMILVNYEEFCDDKIQSIKQLAIALQIELKHEIDSFVDKQFQPKGNSNTDLKVFFGRNYEMIEKMTSVYLT